MPPKKNYTDPKLRDQVKEEVQQGDKGGAPGQWSARKAQFMASEYKKRGGGYTTSKKDQDESQKHLSKWTEEEWQTKEGSGKAKQADGTEKRYLPKKAWEDLNEDEKRETDQKKLEEGREGMQFVQNTGRARSARLKANMAENEEFEGRRGEEKEVHTSEDKAEKPKRGRKPKASKDEKEKLDESEEAGATNGSNTSRKRSQGKTDGAEERPTKKSKSTPRSTLQPTTKTPIPKPSPSSAPAPQASTSRLPKPGQTVHWKALPGWVEGEVIEVAHEEKEVEGKPVKAKKDDPRIVMRSR